VLPSEKEMKQDLMNNAIYNEYNVEELESTFSYVSPLQYYCSQPKFFICFEAVIVLVS
jgi:hypothetical protein